ncbi:MAG: putative oxygen-independent coproporphyrinogen III oxidase [Candidatus Azotimanducaceae bacterium]|jgi:putative oxygen-independent coproporphyrinogen III oxidase
MPADIPLALYIHFPWCVRKCPYCDFNSHEPNGDIPEQAYMEALLNDLDKELANDVDLGGRPIESIFMGGGTPSLISSDAIGRLMRLLGERLNFAPDIEVTLEANPGTTDYEKFSGYKAAGINRLSIGVQSFSGRHLSILGRIHTANEVTEAYQEARDAGFTNINLDLMHGLPDQNPENALDDLKIAIQLAPEHISWYQLTIEPNTVFYKRPPQLPDDDTLWEIYVSGLALLETAGYSRYEVSAFARPDKQARHNLNYWQFGDYIGIGAGAHGKISTSDSVFRTAKTRLPADYIATQKGTRKAITEDDMLLEFLMNTLRLSDGFSRQVFRSRTNLPDTKLNEFVQQAIKQDMLEETGDQIRPTERGLQYLNELLMLA